MLRPDSINRPRDKLKTLEASRFFAAFAVLLFHSDHVLSQARFLGFHPMPFALGGSTGVDFFFVLSGFVIFLAHGRELGGNGSPVAFLKKRFERVFVPLWAVLLGAMALFAFVPNYGWIDMAQPWAILTAFSALPASAETYLAVEWTLRYEVLFYFIFVTALIRLRLGIMVAALFLSIPVIGRIVWPNPMNWMDFFYSAHIYQFFFGMITAALVNARPGRWPVPQFSVGIVLFGLGWWWQGEHGGDSGNTLLLGVAASMIIHALVSWERKRPIDVPRFLLFSGQASYALYLAHFPLLWLTAMALGPFFHALPLFVICLSLPAAALFGSISFHLLVERPLISGFRHLSQRKWLPPLPSAG